MRCSTGPRAGSSPSKRKLGLLSAVSDKGRLCLPPALPVCLHQHPVFNSSQQRVGYSRALTTVEGEGWMGTTIRSVPRFRFVLALGLQDSEPLPESQNSPFLSWGAMLIFMQGGCGLLLVEFWFPVHHIWQKCCLPYGMWMASSSCSCLDARCLLSSSLFFSCWPFYLG